MCVKPKEYHWFCAFYRCNQPLVFCFSSTAFGFEQWRRRLRCFFLNFVVRVFEVSRGPFRKFVFGWTSDGEVYRGWFRLLVFEVSRGRIRNLRSEARQGWSCPATTKSQNNEKKSHVVFFSLFARLGDAENVENRSTLRVLKTRRTNSNTKDSNGSTKIDLNKTKANSGHLKVATLIRPLDTSKTKSLNQHLDTSRAVSKRGVQRSL